MCWSQMFKVIQHIYIMPSSGWEESLMPDSEYQHPLSFIIHYLYVLMYFLFLFMNCSLTLSTKGRHISFAYSGE